MFEWKIIPYWVWIDFELDLKWEISSTCLFWTSSTSMHLQGGILDEQLEDGRLDSVFPLRLCVLLQWRLPPAWGFAEEFQSRRKTSTGRTLCLIGWWNFKGHQSASILTEWLRVSLAFSECTVSACAYFYVCSAVCTRVCLCAGCSNLEAWKKGRGKDGDAEETDLKKKKKEERLYRREKNLRTVDREQMLRRQW